MKTTTLLPLVLLAACAPSAEVLPPPAHAGCELTRDFYAVGSDTPGNTHVIAYDAMGRERSLVRYDQDGSRVTETSWTFDRWGQLTSTRYESSSTLRESVGTFDEWKILEWTHTDAELSDGEVLSSVVDTETRAWSFTENTASLLDRGSDGTVDQLTTFRTVKTDSGWELTDLVDERGDGTVDWSVVQQLNDDRYVVERREDDDHPVLQTWELDEHNRVVRYVETDLETGDDNRVCTYERDGDRLLAEACDADSQRTRYEWDYDDDGLSTAWRRYEWREGDNEARELALEGEAADTWTCSAEAGAVLRVAADDAPLRSRMPIVGAIRSRLDTGRP